MGFKFANTLRHDEVKINSISNSKNGHLSWDHPHRRKPFEKNKYSETKNPRNVIVHSNVCFENRHFSRCRPHAKFKKYQNKLNCLLWKSPSSLDIAPTRDLKEKLSKHRRANSNVLVWKSPLGGKLDSRKRKNTTRRHTRMLPLSVSPSGNAKTALLPAIL